MLCKLWLAQVDSLLVSDFGRFTLQKLQNSPVSPHPRSFFSRMNEIRLENNYYLVMEKVHGTKYTAPFISTSSHSEEFLVWGHVALAKFRA